MAGVALSGMASGLNTDQMIQQLMQIEGAGKTRLTAQQYRTEGRKTALDQVASKLRALETAITDLRSVSTWKNVQTTETTDAAKVGIAFKTGAAVGSYSINVTQLARADQQFFDYTPPGADTQIAIKYAGGTNVMVDVKAGATREEVAAAINAKAESPAFASVVNGQIVLSGKKTGVDLEVASAQLDDDPAKRRASRMAEYEIDGVPQTPSASNTVVNGLAGVDLTLKALTTDPVTVTIGAPGPDKTALQAKVKAFVDTYNSTIDLINGKLTEQPVKTPQIASDYGKGQLRGDPGLTGLLGKLRAAIGGTVAGNPAEFDQLADIGVSVPKANAGGTSSAEALAGKLTIDTEKLTNAIAADPTAIRRMMGGVSGVDGFTQKLEGLLDPVAKVSTGDLAKRSQMADREISQIKDRQTQMDARLKLKEERLRAQFTAMETALSNSQSTSSWVSSQIAGLGSWS